jgi:hypothetical protein
MILMFFARFRRSCKVEMTARMKVGWYDTSTWRRNIMSQSES